MSVHEPIQDFVFTMNYNYQNRHRTRSAYSMGSSLDDIESGGSFTRYYLTQTQEITLGVRAPLTPDRRTFGAYTITYDVNAGYISNQTLALVRQFHCWEVAAEVSFDTDYDSHGNKDRDTSFYVTAYLTGLTGPLQDKHLLSDRIYVLTGQPGRITDEIVITQPKPRAADFNLSLEFLEYKKRILAQL